MAFLSLMDVAVRMDPDGDIATIMTLSQANEFFQDAAAGPGALPTRDISPRFALAFHPACGACLCRCAVCPIDRANH